MTVADYLGTPAWSELVVEPVYGRPTQVWRERPRHVLDLLDLSAGAPDCDFLVQGDRRITYAVFRSALEAGAAELAGLGVGLGAKVLIVLYNSPELLLAQWAAWRLGAVPVFGNRWWTPRELEDAVGRVRPAILVTDMAFDEADGQTKRLVPQVLSGWWALPQPETAVPDPRARVIEDDEAMIVFTAGSTGAPKGVQLSHRNLVWSQQTIHNIRGGGRPPAPQTAAAQKVALMSTPLFHNGAIVTGLGTMLDGGRMVMLTGRFDAEEVLGLIQREALTEWQAVPTMFRRVLGHPKFCAYDLSSLKAAFSGGAMVSLEFVDDVRAAIPSIGDNFVVGYGMTEASFITMGNAVQMRERRGTVGKAMPGVNVKIGAPDENGEGEILARSGGVMIGYFDANDCPIDDDGWYHTGDLGKIDEDAFVYVTGRIKDVVIRGGENISCAYVEAALIAHEDVLEVAVTGYPDEQFGEALAAVIYPRPGSQLSEDVLRAFAKEKLAYFSVPSRWIFRAKPLPVLPTGKVDKQALSLDLKTAPSHV